MSRTSEGDDYDQQFANEGAFWRHRAHLALRGRKGRKALADLREALLALPEKRLISDAMSTVGKHPGPRPPLPGPDATPAERYAVMGQDEQRELVEEQGEGMCTVAAYVWHQRVKAGVDPDQAMRDLPLAPSYDSGEWETQSLGEGAGLSQYVAWRLMSLNDDSFETKTPEERYSAVLAWVDKQLALPPLKAPPRKRKAKADA